MASSSAPNLWVLLGLSLAGIMLMAKKFTKKVIKADFGAFVNKFEILPPPQPAPPKAPHPLTGLTFAVSDLFDINGYVTGFGHPDWERTHEAASQTSAVVSALVDGGATCVGKTVVDEMSFGISGENRHYGAPTNPVAPARIPGGSCSGAAVAVAAKLVDFSLGVDTVGGVRQPAGHCGVFGFRPSYGAVSHVGIVPVSTSFDTVGWFAVDPSILRRVGQVLLQVPLAVQRNPRNVIIADDCFQLSKVPVDQLTQVVIRSTESLFGKQVLKHENLSDYIASKVPSLKALDSKKSNGDVKFSSLRSLANMMQLIRRNEFNHNHFEWINSVKPAIDPLISALVHERMELAEKDLENFRSVKGELRSALNSLLKDDGVIVIPTVSSPPPKLGAKELLSEDYLLNEFSLTGLASISGCCQVTIPLGLYENYPVSVSFIARHGGDRFLLDTLNIMHASLQKNADEAGKSKSSSDVVTKEASADMAKEKGNSAFKAKNWQNAIKFYTDAIKLNSSNATYFNNRAAAYLEVGSFIQAEADCSKAIDLDKKNVKAYLRRGTAREMLGYYKEAIEDFRYALILEPTNKRAAASADRLTKLFQ
ncbi:translocon at the outer membrane of chloroplasts 64-like [Rutidosis leptorrhynchoides]|uniref:translocon at the outer membrane of chloroplasts 64-like n=1 Tax=Rutidosis leptorrhynchoides TaxID=125765 RepID=UPI003A997CDE